MSKIEIKKTELVWRGKYDEEGKLVPAEKPGPYPFQIVESINEPRIEKGDDGTKQTTLFDTWKGDEGSSFKDGWKNKLIWGDNKFVMSSLLEKFAGKIDLIYIDPPFATGGDFKSKIEVGEDSMEIIKEHSMIEEKAYRDTWGKGFDSYLSMMYERLTIMKDLLSSKGQLYVHLDWHVGHYIKVVLDEIFGESFFRNEIVWRYRRWPAPSKDFQKMHDTIFRYSKSKEVTWNQQYEELSESSLRQWKGKSRVDKVSEYGTRFSETIEKDSKGAQMSDVWEISQITAPFSEYVNYNTQKPEELIKRIIIGTSNEGDLVADFFNGSGTTISVAEKLNRRWIGVDLGRYSIHTTRKRLLEIEHSKSLLDEGKKYGKKAKPFELLNLGRYERQFWKVKAFGIKDENQSLFQYLAFVLKLYGAEPISGSAQIHGKKGNSLVYIGAVDSPVTIQEVTDALNDTKDMGMKELHVLGWEWEMGLNDAIQEVAKQMNVRLKLRIIPMDAIDPQASGRGDVRFFELAYFKTQIETKGKAVKVKLEDFVVPHTDLITPDVKASIKKWSDWIDYWAVDFDFQNDTFNNGWTSYRTKQERKLKLTADHEYNKAGNYKVFVKIIDIFGIDTSQVYEIKVK